jgi:hypothetical protein
MKKIKTLIGLGVAGILALAMPLFLTAFTVTAPVAMTGCIAPGGGTNINTAQIDATALILQNAARVGAVAAITPPSGNTNNAVYFELAAQAIGTFLTGKDYSPAAFQQALIDIKVPQANNIWVQLGIGAVIDLYQVYFSQYVQGKVNGNFAAGTFLVAIQNGFNQATGNPVTPPPAKLKAGSPQPLAPSVLPRPLKR